MTFYLKGVYIKLMQYFQLLYSIVIKDLKNDMKHYHILLIIAQLCI